MRSSLVLMVASVFMAPTVMACGAAPGDRMVAYPLRPSLPAATTTTIPLFQAASTAWHRGSCEQLSKIGRPSERLITRTLYWLLSVTAFSMAAITTLSLLAPF